jgi:hypothetical protein
MGGGESSFGGMAVALERGVGLALWWMCCCSVALERRIGSRGRVEWVFAMGGRVGRSGHYEEKKREGRKDRRQGGMMMTV